MNSKSNRDTVLARFQEGPELLEQAVAGLQEPELDASPAQGGWTIRQIVHHLADGDDLWKVGLKAAFGDEDGEFDFSWYGSHSQQEWARRWNYTARSLDSSIAFIKAVRVHVAELVETAPDAWNRTIGVRGPRGVAEKISVGSILEMQVNHVDHHVKRIMTIRRELEGA
jgi:hypothetical protein